MKIVHERGAVWVKWHIFQFYTPWNVFGMAKAVEISDFVHELNLSAKWECPTSNFLGPDHIFGADDISSLVSILWIRKKQDSTQAAV